MATIKISELFPIEEFKPDDLLEVVQDGKSRRASLEQLDDYMGSNLPITTEEDAGDLLQVDGNGKWNKSKLIDKPNGIAPLDNSGKIPLKNLPLDISTTIDKTSTDSTIPTSKAVYDLVELLGNDVVCGYYDVITRQFYKDIHKTEEIIGKTDTAYIDINPNGTRGIYTYTGYAYILQTAGIIEIGDVKDVNLWELNDGIYYVPFGKTIYAKDKEQLIPVRTPAYVIILRRDKAITWVVITDIIIGIGANIPRIYTGYSKHDGTYYELYHIIDSRQVSNDIYHESDTTKIPNIYAILSLFNSRYNPDTNKVSMMQDLYSYAENISNKVTEINSSSTDTQYPSAKAVYDFIKDNPEIPIIKIEASQMVSADTIQFTENQWEALTDNETKILFADVRDVREEYNAYYRILYKCGDYENISSNDGSLYYEITGNSSKGFGLIDYRLNGEERQLKMWSDFLPFIGDVNTGDMLKLEGDVISKAISNVDYATPSYVQAQIQAALYVDENAEVE